MTRFRLSFLRLTIALLVGLCGSQAWAANPSQAWGASPLESATVSFGLWMTSPPLDRFPNVSNTRFRNTHVLVPNIVTIKAGGSVNFIISGLHNIAVYDDGTRPESIDLTAVVNTTGTPSDIPIINDANNRIYRGLDPTLQPIDRVEVVEFTKPGLYLVICGIRPHLVNGMYGYVRVLP